MVPLLPMGADDNYHAKIKEMMKVPVEPGTGVNIRQANAIKVKLFLTNFLFLRYVATFITVSNI